MLSHLRVKCLIVWNSDVDNKVSCFLHLDSAFIIISFDFTFLDSFRQFHTFLTHSNAVIQFKPEIVLKP